MFLELNRTDVQFSYNSTTPLETVLTARNVSENRIVTFKVKTTSPNLFDVNPSKGILMPRESKNISFRTNSPVSRQQAEKMLAQEKFLIQWMVIPQMRPSNEIEDLWRVNRNNPLVVKSVKLRLVIDGVGMGPTPGSLQTPINQILTPMLDNNNINRAAANMFQTAAGNTFRGSEVGMTPNGTDDIQLGSRLDELNRQEEQLLVQRDNQFNKMTRITSNKSCMGWVKKMGIILLFCLIGWGIHKFIEYRRKHPKVIITKEYQSNPNDNVITIGEKHVDRTVQVVDTRPLTHEPVSHKVVEVREEVVNTQPQTYRTKDGDIHYHQQQHNPHHRKVILTAPEDAQVIVNRINNESIRLTVLGAQYDSEGLHIDY